MGAWRNGLCGCFDNCGLCVITYFLPCVTAGHNAEHVGKSCFLYGCLSLLGPISIWSRAKIRGMIREQKGIDGSFCDDCILHWFCGICALIQEGQFLLEFGHVFFLYTLLWGNSLQWCGRNSKIPVSMPWLVSKTPLTFVRPAIFYSIVNRTNFVR